MYKLVGGIVLFTAPEVVESTDKLDLNNPEFMQTKELIT